MQNILIVNHYASIYQGRHFYIGGYLADKNYSVTVMRAGTKHSDGEKLRDFTELFLEEKINGIHFVFVRARRYGKSTFRRILNILDYTINSIRAYHKGNFDPPDVVVASSVHPLAWLVGHYIAKKAKCPLVIEVRDLWPETLVSLGSLHNKSVAVRFLYWFEKYFYKKADALIFTMEGGQDYIRKININTSCNHVNNGVDLETFYHLRDSNIYKGQEFSNENTFKVVYTGSMGRSNRIMDILESARILKNRNMNDIEFLFFGSGKDMSPYIDFVEKNDLDSVHFMGRISHDYIPSVLSQADLLVISGYSSPLYDYGVSLNKLFEYFAAGKPILSNMPCGYNLIDRYNAGITLSDESPEAFAEGVLYFKSLGKKEIQKYADGALKAAMEYDYHKLADQYEDILLSVDGMR